jgi:hypothetical protein
MRVVTRYLPEKRPRTSAKMPAYGSGIRENEDWGDVDSFVYNAASKEDKSCLVSSSSGGQRHLHRSTYVSGAGGPAPPMFTLH